ncbi:MAG: DUF1559 domain-containing protein [Planctomycetaceae bacterium]|nr:DUF1559 domain-containing protein [Planctomycetaceae bacterium]
MKTNKSGFTLVELLVVIAIIALLISLLIPAVQAAREMARRSQCSNNMRQMALAMNVYHESLKSLPPGNLCLEELSEKSCHQINSIYCGSMGWPAFILPYLEMTTLYDTIDFSKLAYTPETGDRSYHEANGPMGDTANQQVGENMPPVFACPSATRQSKHHKDYGVNGFDGFPQSLPDGGGVFHANSGIRFADVKDGLSNTFLMLETCHRRKFIPREGGDMIETLIGLNPFLWVNEFGQGYALVSCGIPPENKYLKLTINTRDPYIPTYGARSDHSGGVFASVCDGSVHFISEKIDYTVYLGIFTRSGGEDVRLP